MKTREEIEARIDRCEFRAVYIPAHSNDIVPWLTGGPQIADRAFRTNTWAKDRLAEGWEIIENPETTK